MKKIHESGVPYYWCLKYERTHELVENTEKEELKIINKQEPKSISV